MPFGATNAPATFQRLMHNCLGDLNMTWCVVYLDDIIVFSDNPKDHIVRLEAVFKKLATAGLKLKPSKCFFFKEEIDYLGHLVSGKEWLLVLKRLKQSLSCLYLRQFMM